MVIPQDGICGSKRSIKRYKDKKENNMINLINGLDFSVVAFFGILFAFAATCIAIAKLNKFLPRDMGRAFAHDGSLSAGKPRGAGKRDTIWRYA